MVVLFMLMTSRDGILPGAVDSAVKTGLSWLVLGALGALGLVGCADTEEDRKEITNHEVRELLPAPGLIEEGSGWKTAEPLGDGSIIALYTLCHQTHDVVKDAYYAFRFSSEVRAGAVGSYKLSPLDGSILPDNVSVAATIGIFETVTTADNPIYVDEGIVYRYMDNAREYGCPEYFSALQGGTAGPGVGGVSAVRVTDLPAGAVGYYEVSYRRADNKGTAFGDPTNPTAETYLYAFAEVDDRYLVFASYRGISFEVGEMDLQGLLQVVVDNLVNSSEFKDE
jgi:hypothetical protein